MTFSVDWISRDSFVCGNVACFGLFPADRKFQRLLYGIGQISYRVLRSTVFNGWPHAIIIIPSSLTDALYTSLDLLILIIQSS